MDSLSLKAAWWAEKYVQYLASLKELGMCLISGQTSSFARRTQEGIKSVKVAEQEVNSLQM